MQCNSQKAGHLVDPKGVLRDALTPSHAQTVPGEGRMMPKFNNDAETGPDPSGAGDLSAQAKEECPRRL